MRNDPASLLFGSYRRQILELLLGHPDLSLHVREIARRTGIPAGSLHRELRALAEVAILERMPVEGQVRYRANVRGRLFGPLAVIFGGKAAANDAAPAARVAEPVATYGAAETRASRHERMLDRLNVPARVLSAFARRHGLERLSFFGSVTRDNFRPDSDVDVLVEFAGPRTNPFAKLDIADELSALFGGRDVDVVTPGVLRNPLRRANIERDLLTVHGG